MKIYLPWKKEGWDGHPHRAILEINVDYRHSQPEDNRKLTEELEARRRKEEEKRFEKRVKSGLPRCPGHKLTPIYTKEGKCSICGKYRY